MIIFYLVQSHCSYLDISISPKSIEKKAWFSRLWTGSVKPHKIKILTNKYIKKIDERWKESLINVPCEIFIEHRAHCGRLWVVEVSCPVQVNFLTKVITFLIWKCHFFPLLLSLFLPGVVKSSAFCTLCSQFRVQKSFEFQFYTKKSCFANNSEHFDRKVTRAFWRVFLMSFQRSLDYEIKYKQFSKNI